MSHLAEIMLFALACSLGQSSVPTSTTATAPAATSPTTAQADLRMDSRQLEGLATSAAVQLSPDLWPGDVKDASAYREYLAQRTKQLRQAVAQAESPAHQAEARLNLVRWQLGRQVEPAASWLALGLDNDADRQSIVQITTAAQQQLEAIKELLQALPASAPSTQPAQSDEWADQLALLEPWPAALRAAAVGDADESATAAQQLAPLCDPQHGALSAAARFWQAALFRRAGQLPQALKQLPLALADPQDDPYGVAPRLLRCRALAESGMLTAALALVMQIEGNRNAWLDSRTADLARPAAVLLHLELLDRLADQLESNNRAEQAEHVRQSRLRLRDQTFPPDQIILVPRLRSVLPGLEPAPASRPDQAVPTAPTTLPA